MQDAPPLATPKTCSICGKSGDLSDFHRKGKGKDGQTRYNSACKVCATKKATERYHKKTKNKKNFKNKYKLKIYLAENGCSREEILEQIKLFLLEELGFSEYS